MANEQQTTKEQAGVDPVRQHENLLFVAPSPHLSDTGITTRRMMVDVIIALVPLMIMGFYFFKWFIVVQVGLCVLACMGSEALFTWMRGKPIVLDDCSAAVTGIILGLSLPWSAPWYIPVIGSIMAMGFGKAVFGGLGYNLFNPAMVGRAFVMLSFAKALGASAYINPEAALEIVTEATPLTAARTQADFVPSLWPLFVGNHNGSMGETSALACILGGLYLCLRKSASWEIPLGVILSVGILAGCANLLGLTRLTMLHHLVSGSILFGAFFIATDPVSSPLTPKGKFIFGVGIGLFVMLIRIFSGYPEGVMFAVLLMNGSVPLLNRLTIPRPLGGAMKPAT